MNFMHRTRYWVPAVAVSALAVYGFAQDQPVPEPLRTGPPTIGAVQIEEPPVPDDAERLEALEGHLRDLQESNDLLVREVDTLRREIRRLNDRLGELATGGAAGPRNLLGQMALDENFRRDVMRAVQGQVVIENRTASTQPFFVNGVRWSVPPGRYVVWVTLGEVTAHLPDEPPQNFTEHWRLLRDPDTGEPRHYQLWLNIGFPPARPAVEPGVVARR